VRLIDLPDLSALALDKAAIPERGRQEPALGAPPLLPVSPEALRLDPTRVEFAAPLPPPRNRLALGPIGSLLVHLLPCLALVDWVRTPPEITVPIPIQLVIEQPPPPPPPPPQPAERKPAAKPPQGRRSSDDMAEVAAPKIEKGGSNEPSPVAREPSPAAPEPQPVLVAPPQPPPAPLPPAEQLTDEPLPRPAETQTAMLVLPEPPHKPAPVREPAKIRMPKPLESEWPLPLHHDPPRGLRSANLAGPASIRDEYCAEALSLTLRHIGLLPLSLTGGRQGQTILSIRVLGDGTVNSVRVARSSGYPDIDERIEKMVFEVGRFPPLPQWMGSSMEFTFQLHFPHPLQR
jgi:periplasmic protein TonB